MAKIEIPQFAEKKELFDFLVENKSTLIAQKCHEIKRADSIFHHVTTNTTSKEHASNASALQIKAVINTTNLMDSHSDVHIPNIWKKSLRENKTFYFLQEHKMDFKDIISDTAKATAETMKWKSLGFNFTGDTQALIFDAELQKDRNPFMFGQYSKGYVKNHSVGMRYVKLFLAVNDDEFKEEFTVWNQYVNEIANKKDAEDQGFFWAVTEAKIIEGSAVPIGSNRATPTLEVGEKGAEPPLGTHTEPQIRTRKGLLF
jgi:hypothetical protein